jgi:hypothetical protein
MYGVLLQLYGFIDTVPAILAQVQVQVQAPLLGEQLLVITHEDRAVSKADLSSTMMGGMGMGGCPGSSEAWCHVTSWQHCAASIPCPSLECINNGPLQAMNGQLAPSIWK